MTQEAQKFVGPTTFQALTANTVYTDLWLAMEGKDPQHIRLAQKAARQLVELKKTLGMAIILITHNFGIISGIANRVAVMFRGAIVEYGETREVLSNPQHPYTQALIRCIPQLGARRERLTTIDHAALEAAQAKVR